MATGQGGAGGTLTRPASDLSLTAIKARRYWRLPGHHPGGGFTLLQ
ncbi:MAG: hypothetical protein OXI08_07505 [Cyanobacteria bacterium MAG IRC4_bin_6]|nr:hypothetical protein [Cyanobacteria bacterium MAG IRC4_bin_6]